MDEHEYRHKSPLVPKVRPWKIEIIQDETGDWFFVAYRECALVDNSTGATIRKSREIPPVRKNLRDVYRDRRAVAAFDTLLVIAQEWEDDEPVRMEVLFPEGGTE